MRLQEVWNKKETLLAEADELFTESARIYSESTLAWGKSAEAQDESKNLRSKSDVLHTKAKATRDKGYELFVSAVHDELGSIEIQWSRNDSCTLANGRRFEPAQSAQERLMKRRTERRNIELNRRVKATWAEVFRKGTLTTVQQAREYEETVAEIIRPTSDLVVEESVSIAKEIQMGYCWDCGGTGVKDRNGGASFLSAYGYPQRLVCNTCNGTGKGDTTLEQLAKRGDIKSEDYVTLVLLIILALGVCNFIFGA